MEKVYVKFFGDAGFCGTDFEYFEMFNKIDNIEDTLDEMAYEYGKDNAESFGYNDYDEDDDYDEYDEDQDDDYDYYDEDNEYENWSSDWDYITQEEYIENLMEHMITAEFELEYKEELMTDYNFNEKQMEYAVSKFLSENKCFITDSEGHFCRSKAVDDNIMAYESVDEEIIIGEDGYSTLDIIFALNREGYDEYAKYTRDENFYDWLRDNAAKIVDEVGENK